MFLFFWGQLGVAISVVIPIVLSLVIFAASRSSR